MAYSHRIKKINNNLILFAILVLFANQVLLGQVLAAKPGSGLASGASSKLQVSDNASEAEMITAVVPQDKDFTRPYQWQGQTVTLSAQVSGNGYDMLAAMDRTIALSQLTADQQQRYNDLVKNIYHPCCDAPIGSCGCKHAVAAKGLIKYLLSQSWTDAQISDEVFLWDRFWWPKHYVTVALYLQSQGINPATVTAKDWLSSRLSTLRAGRQMSASLSK